MAIAAGAVWYLRRRPKAGAAQQGPAGGTYFRQGALAPQGPLNAGPWKLTGRPGQPVVPTPSADGTLHLWQDESGSYVVV